MLNRITTRSLWRSCSPGVERMTFRARASRDDAASYTDYQLNHVQPKAARSEELVAVGIVQTGLRHRVFTVWQDDLDNAEAPAPGPGDLIVQTSDGSSEWVIQTVKTGLFGNKHVCLCQERA